VRPDIVECGLEIAYAQMANEKRREAEALEWCESTSSFSLASLEQELGAASPFVDRQSQE
jgi:hypothetical protein